MENDTEFSSASGKRILQNSTDKRVSKDAGHELLGELELYADEIASKAKEFAESAGRKTVRAEDIRKALKVMD